MNADQLVQLIPIIVSAIGVILNGLVIWYNARIAASKTASDIDTAKLDAGMSQTKTVGDLSLGLAQQAQVQYKDCLAQNDKLQQRLDTEMALRNRYYQALLKILVMLRDILTRHDVEADDVDCDYKADMDCRVALVVVEVEAALNGAADNTSQV